MADKKTNLPVGRIPPHNLEAEASVLGSALVDNEAIDRVEGLITSEVFYKEAHRKIWRAMESLRLRNEPVDLVTLSEELKKNGELDNVGGLSYLVGLSEATPTAAYAEHYAQIVAEKHMLRRLIGAAGEAMRLAYDEAGSVEEVIDQAGRLIMDVAVHGLRHDFQEMRELVTQAHERIARLREDGNVSDLLSTGFADLDRVIGGLGPGSLNIIAARPSMGKTAFALTIAQNVALHGETPVAIFSLEMPAIDLVLRLLSSEARVDMNRIRQAHLSDRDYERLVNAAGKIYEAPIFIDDTPGLTLMEVRSRARRLATQHKIGLIIIDYMQLMSGGQSSRSGENRQQEISAISRGLKSLARELEVPVVALSQLSRAVESRPNKHPLLSDLRESGSIEQDADLVVFIYRDDYYNEHSEQAGVAEIIIGKQRNGPTDTVKLQFHAAHVRFNDLAREF